MVKFEWKLHKNQHLTPKPHFAMFKFLLFAALAVGFAWQCSAQYRLPNETRPYQSSYTIDLGTLYAGEFKNLRFKGTANFHLIVDEPTKFITFHQRHLTVASAVLVHRITGEVIEDITDMTFDEEKDLITFAVTEELEVQTNGGSKYFLIVEYWGTLATEKGNAEFQSTFHLPQMSAREILIGCDEPGLSGPFEATIIVKEHLSVVGNTYIKEEKQEM